MRVKRLADAVLVFAAWFIFGQLIAFAQQATTQAPSLGNLARQLRSEREKAAQKPAKSYSNDNLPARPAPGSLTVAAQMAAAEGAEGGAETGAAETAGGEPAQPVGEEGTTPKQPGKAEAAKPPSPEAESADVHDEEYYRKAIAELRTRLQLHQRQLGVLEQKLAQGRMVFNPDPQKTLEQESTPQFYSDVTKLRDDIEKKKQEVTADEQAITDLQDQLRREGHPAGWLR